MELTFHGGLEKKTSFLFVTLRFLLTRTFQYVSSDVFTKNFTSENKSVWLTFFYYSVMRQIRDYLKHTQASLSGVQQVTNSFHCHSPYGPS